MFTSRAEFRLQLREDNADIRLGETAIRLGLYGETRKGQFEERLARVNRAVAEAKQTIVGSGREWMKRLEQLSLPATQQGIGFTAYCHRRDVDVERAMQLLPAAEEMLPRDRASLAAFIHYDGYLDKQAEEVERFRQMETQAIPEGLDFASIQGLSSECTQKLENVRPQSLGQAARISGMTPAAMTALMIHLKRAEA